jgi:hypothetical protein
MPVPTTEDGVFDGGLLFDGCGYRVPSEIVDFSYAAERLGLVKDKHSHFVAEFLIKHHTPQFSLPVWDSVRESCVCESIAEAKALTERFVMEGDDGDA